MFSLHFLQRIARSLFCDWRSDQDYLVKKWSKIRSWSSFLQKRDLRSDHDLLIKITFLWKIFLSLKFGSFFKIQTLNCILPIFLLLKTFKWHKTPNYMLIFGENIQFTPKKLSKSDLEKWSVFPIKITKKVI